MSVHGTKDLGRVTRAACPAQGATRVIRLAGGRAVTLGQYARAWKAVLQSPSSQTFERGLGSWWTVGRDELLAEFRAGLHDRINRHDVAYGKGRKWDAEWQSHARMDADRINRAGRDRLLVRVTEITTDDWRTRFAHRLEGAEPVAKRVASTCRRSAGKGHRETTIPKPLSHAIPAALGRAELGRDAFGRGPGGGRLNER